MDVEAHTEVIPPGAEFLTGAERPLTVPGFSESGQTTTLEWNEQRQNFSIVDFDPRE